MNNVNMIFSGAIIVILIILILEIRKYGIVYIKNKEVREENRKIKLEYNELNNKYSNLILINDEMVIENNKLSLNNQELIDDNHKMIFQLSERKINEYEFEYQTLIELYNKMKIENHRKSELISSLKSQISIFSFFVNINDDFRNYRSAEGENKKIIREYINKLFNSIEDGLSMYYNDNIKLRTTILFPKTGNGNLLKEYLQVYAYFEIGNDSIYDVKFYIGEDLKRRREESGVAGIAYIEKRVAYAKFNINVVPPGKENNDAQYHIFVPIEQEKEGILKYSMIYAKYIKAGDTLDGVISIDSMKKDLFDDKNLVRYFDEFVFYNIEQFLGRYADDIMKGWQQ